MRNGPEFSPIPHGLRQALIGFFDCLKQKEAHRRRQSFQAAQGLLNLRSQRLKGDLTVPQFLFATGIENSSPTINNGRQRVDEMESCRHYELWRDDFALAPALGVRVLRYGPPLYKTFLGPDRFDWAFADATFGELNKHGLIPIADLCHFGVPDWIGDFQNPDLPALFASYAKAFASRFPSVQLFTPVNEMFVCATFSAAYGWWNEQLHDDKSFVTALKHIVKANVLAMEAILSVRRDAIFVQSESSEYFHASSPKAVWPADLQNERRFLSLDLNYGHSVSAKMYRFLMDNRMTETEYDFFMCRDLKGHCIMGNDYYGSNEHYVDSNGKTSFSGEIFGYSEITSQYYSRYQIPVMHTETNFGEGPQGIEAARWLYKEWANVLLHLRKKGVPIVGFTWYSLTDQVDWDTALGETNGRVNPVGLYDLDRKPRAVGKAYKDLIAEWSNAMPKESHLYDGAARAVLPLSLASLRPIIVNALPFLLKDQKPQPVEGARKHCYQEQSIPPSDAKSEQDKACQEKGAYRAQPPKIGISVSHITPHSLWCCGTKAIKTDLHDSRRFKLDQLRGQRRIAFNYKMGHAPR